MRYEAVFKFIITFFIILVSMKASQETFIQNILETGDKKYSNLNLEEYLTRHIKVRHGANVIPYSFAGHAPLQWMTRNLAEHPDIVAMTAAQVAFSTWMLGRTLKKQNGTSYKSAIFFPSKVSMGDFVQDRVNQLIYDSPYLSKMLSDTDSTDNVKLKKFDKFTMAFRATSTKSGVKTYDADIIILDEYDEHNSENIEFTDDRLLHSTLKWKIAGSQPSIPDFGIHAEFLSGTQHYWLIRCSCSHWTNLIDRFESDPFSIFGKNKSGDIFYQCDRCNKKLNNQIGEYIAKYPKRDKASVQISQFFYNLNTPERMHKGLQRAMQSTTKRKNYLISKECLPYASNAEKPITAQVLADHIGSHGLQDTSEFFTYMGADQGDIVHMVFGEPTRDHRVKIIGLLKCSVLDEELHSRSIEKMYVFQGNVDAGPNKSWSKRLALQFPEAIKIQYFTKNFSLGAESVPGFDDVDVIKVNRDESLQDTGECHDSCRLF
jgi:hypothetical protein